MAKLGRLRRVKIQEFELIGDVLMGGFVSFYVMGSFLSREEGEVLEAMYRRRFRCKFGVPVSKFLPPHLALHFLKRSMPVRITFERSERDAHRVMVSSAGKCETCAHRQVVSSAGRVRKLSFLGHLGPKPACSPPKGGAGACGFRPTRPESITLCAGSPGRPLRRVLLCAARAGGRGWGGVCVCVCARFDSFHTLPQLHGGVHVFT